MPRITKNDRVVTDIYVASRISNNIYKATYIVDIDSFVIRSGITTSFIPNDKFHEKYEIMY